MLDLAVGHHLIHEVIDMTRSGGRELLGCCKVVTDELGVGGRGVIRLRLCEGDAKLQRGMSDDALREKLFAWLTEEIHLVIHIIK